MCLHVDGNNLNFDFLAVGNLKVSQTTYHRFSSFIDSRTDLKLGCRDLISGTRYDFKIVFTGPGQTEAYSRMCYHPR
jgi:hypothetical protein